MARIRGEDFVAYTSATHRDLILEGMLVSCCGEYYRVETTWDHGRKILNRETNEMSNFIRPIPKPFLFCMDDPLTKELVELQLNPQPI